MSAYELQIWKEMDRIHPFGDWRADMRNGIIADTLRAANGAEPIGLHKYIIRPQPESEPQEVNDSNVADMLGLTFE